MYPLWDEVISPVLVASGARRLVEIGALRGENTRFLLENLGDEVELHVIDPVPEFDPAEHEERFGGRYVFHRDISHNVLPSLPPVDVALVDGDHNWFTVFHELRMLTEVSDAHGVPVPVLILHDVGWPYGRRDLYYTPERIPPEFRQPYAQRGMRPGQDALMKRPGRGTNPTLDNALHEGGPRNGVMTALDDWIDGFDRPVRRVDVPIYYGLAIVVEQARLDTNPELAAALDDLETLAGRNRQLALSEQIRLDNLWVDNVLAQAMQEKATDRASRRYLDLLKGALLNEHYLEHELRVHHLLQTVKKGGEANVEALRDPVRELNLNWPDLVQQRQVGGRLPIQGGEVAGPHFAGGRVRLDQIEEALDRRREAATAGDIVVLDAASAGTGVFARGYLDAHAEPDTQVVQIGRFRAREGDELSLDSAHPDLGVIRDVYARYGLLDERVQLLGGESAATAADASVSLISLLLVAEDSLDPAAVTALLGRCAADAEILVRGDHDDVVALSEALDDTSISWLAEDLAQLHVAGTSGGGDVRDRPVQAERPVAPGPRAGDRLDLSVVVCFYNMRREAHRTLQSLSRSYQVDSHGLDYEVIVVDNGSSPDQRLGEEFVQQFGPEFIYVDLGAEERAHPSPAVALNHGIERARGDMVAIMIDGAHVLSPGVFKHTQKAVAAYELPVVITQHWYVGPGEQSEVIYDGYDQAYEDRLFRSIDWPHKGYRLFEISHPIARRDWFDGLGESNCIVVPRAVLEQVGGYDERFSEPGGEYSNLEFYERVSTDPRVEVVKLLGEASFHQVHGGTTTNQPDPSVRSERLAHYKQRYEDILGRPFRGAGREVQYLGGLRRTSKRSRARRLVSWQWRSDDQLRDVDGPPVKPSPVGDEARSEFIEAAYNHLGWKDVTWMGQPVEIAGTDLIAYQQLFTDVGPDTVVLVGDMAAGRCLFWASMCDLAGSGQVIWVPGDEEVADIVHPRISRVGGAPEEPSTVQAVSSAAGAIENALVVLAPVPVMAAMARFRAYRDLIGVGSYAIFEHTIVNGNPVWVSYGQGPREAASMTANDDPDFVIDLAAERGVFTFNPGGYLKRVN
ncbi:MAG: CmcI family methyltransferase [Acidimicrobiales bacterium]